MDRSRLEMEIDTLQKTIKNAKNITFVESRLYVEVIESRAIIRAPFLNELIDSIKLDPELLRFLDDFRKSSYLFKNGGTKNFVELAYYYSAAFPDSADSIVMAILPGINGHDGIRDFVINFKWTESHKRMIGEYCREQIEKVGKENSFSY